MQRYEQQLELFAIKPRRLDLMNILDINIELQNKTINVWRNHAFEYLVSIIKPYAMFGKWSPNWRIYDYDDSLSFFDYKDADLDLVWLDSNRFRDVDDEYWAIWLEGRLRILRGLSVKPIILATWARHHQLCTRIADFVGNIPGVYWADLAQACEKDAVDLIDQRTAVVSGTPISAVAQVMIARRLACHWLPATLFPALKAVAVDLDNTLYRGILGEDGAQGVELTTAHKEFQTDLKKLRERGVFLVLISRNEAADVKALFEQRDDFPLRWADFSNTQISWGEKADALASAANALRISPDAILFIDDNLGELLNVATRLPTAYTAFAHDDAEATRNMLRFFPRLWRWSVDAEDAHRIDDLAANETRAALVAEAHDPVAYFQSLQVALHYRFDPLDQLSRLAELCNKTNQFNLAMRRLSTAEVAERLANPEAAMISVQLKDRLSDSGVIAVMAVHREGHQLIVEELCISCRAMGRHLEDSVILGPLSRLELLDGCDDLVFEVRHGPRNQPALDWLAGLLSLHDTPSPGRHSIPASRARLFNPHKGIHFSQIDEAA